MALGSTQPLTEMSTRSISWGLWRPVRKAENLPPFSAFVTKAGNFLEHSGPLRTCNGTALPFLCNVKKAVVHASKNMTKTVSCARHSKAWINFECIKTVTAEGTIFLRHLLQGAESFLSS